MGLLAIVEGNESVGNGLMICGVEDDAVEFEEVVVGLRLLLLGVGGRAEEEQEREGQDAGLHVCLAVRSVVGDGGILK